MYPLIKKRIVLGVTGGIAAYKSALLLRLLRQAGADVRVVMTKNATEFVTPLTFQALSGKPVHQELLDLEMESAMGHIELARWADLILVAPGSAHFIACYANGFAEDLLSTLCLAADSPVAIAPAMNQQMWLNPATQENVDKLKTRGIHLIGPATGDQACGENGPGRMVAPETIMQSIAESFETHLLTGSRVMVTAGPTRERIDPVRYISNESSGQMGYALVRAAVEAGADVSVISGPVKLPVPDKTRLVNVTSAKEMYEAVMKAIGGIDIFISAAAVADYRLKSVPEQKIKKHVASMQLNLVKNSDIITQVAALDNAPFTVGFAAETENLEENARQKLSKKNLDMIAANKVGDGLGFNTADNALTVIWKDGQKQLQQAPKEKLAKHLIDLVAEHYHSKGKIQTH